MRRSGSLEPTRRLKHPGEWSDGKFSLVEVAIPRGRATPLHTDPSDETFYVLEGEVLFHVDGAEYETAAGDTVSLRSGVPHAFVATSEVARFLVLEHAGDSRRLLPRRRRAGDTRRLCSRAAPGLRADGGPSNRKHGVEILGPPPFSVTEAAVAGA